MKIKSELPFNTIIHARRKPGFKGIVASLEIPSGATIEMSDKEWEPYSYEAKAYIENGSLKLVEAPKMTKEEQEKADAAELSAAEAVLAKLKKPSSKKLKNKDKEGK